MARRCVQWRAGGLRDRRLLAICRDTDSRQKGPAMKVRIHVSLKPGVLDPQGRAIQHSLEGLGFTGVNDARQGKLIELDVDSSVTDDQLDEMCRKLLANMVIENYRIERIAA
jgi:phosphoribosylformylglycinamidine synthase PurS subunit